jgi:hypothetical protein
LGILGVHYEPHHSRLNIPAGGNAPHSGANLKNPTAVRLTGSSIATAIGIPACSVRRYYRPIALSENRYFPVITFRVSK